VKRIFRPLEAVFAANYALMLEYRAEIFFWILSGSLPFILMGIWMEAAKEGNLVFSAMDFGRYFISSFIIRQFNLVWVIWEFEEEVVEGRLSPRLLMPFDPGWYFFMSHVAERFVRLPFIAIVLGLFFAINPQFFWMPSLPTILLFLLLGILVFCLRFIMQYTFALFSFWTERASAIEDLWFLFYLFLSGLIAPLDFFPQAISQAVLWTPFPYMIYVPASLLMGREIDFARALLVTLAWIAFFFFCNRWLWRQGLKKYSGMGA